MFSNGSWAMNIFYIENTEDAQMQPGWLVGAVAFHEKVGPRPGTYLFKDFLGITNNPEQTLIISLYKGDLKEIHKELLEELCSNRA